MKLTAEQKAKRLRVREVKEVLDGKLLGHCEWPLAYDDCEQAVYCDQPAFEKHDRVRIPIALCGALRCFYHAKQRTPRAQQAEFNRNLRKFRSFPRSRKSRAEIIAVRDSLQEKAA